LQGRRAGHRQGRHRRGRRRPDPGHRPRDRRRWPPSSRPPAPSSGTARWACSSSPAFENGTEAIAQAIARIDAFSIAGGGDTLAAIAKYGIEKDVGYISTGGGAFLEVLEGKTLPAFEILVMHGSSSVPQEWLAIIRQFGGDIKETYGVPVEEIQRGIRSGVRKINIDTDIRLAMTGAMRQVFAQQPSEFDPRKALTAAKNAARGIVKARFEAFGCAGHASKIKPVPLEAMARRYA
jgi:hypothetical protein